MNFVPSRFQFMFTISFHAHRHRRELPFIFTIIKGTSFSNVDSEIVGCGGGHDSNFQIFVCGHHHSLTSRRYKKITPKI